MIRIFTKIIKIVLFKISFKISWCVTYMKFIINGVDFKKSFDARGIPIINVSLKGNFKIGENFMFNSGIYYNMIGRQQRCFFIVGNGAQLLIGNNVGMSSTAIVCQTEIQIEDDVRIGGGVVIYDTDFHSLSNIERVARPEITDNINTQKVKICKGVFIGAHSIVLKGVVIGENSIIGAGSVVSKSIPSNQIWAGNPAKFIRSIN